MLRIKSLRVSKRTPSSGRGTKATQPSWYVQCFHLIWSEVFTYEKHGFQLWAQHHLWNALQWRHNERDGVSNHRAHHSLLNRLFRRRSKKTSKLRVTGLWVGNSLVTGEFPAQMASNEENVSIWWRHHELNIICEIVSGDVQNVLLIYSVQRVVTDLVCHSYLTKSTLASQKLDKPIDMFTVWVVLFEFAFSFSCF